MSTVNVGRLTANTKLNIPSYTQAQIDALDVETGMVVWNSTEEQVQIYYGEWACHRAEHLLLLLDLLLLLLADQ